MQVFTRKQRVTRYGIFLAVGVVIGAVVVSSINLSVPPAKQKNAQLTAPRSSAERVAAANNSIVGRFLLMVAMSPDFPLTKQLLENGATILRGTAYALPAKSSRLQARVEVKEIINFAGKALIGGQEITVGSIINVVNMQPHGATQEVVVVIPHTIGGTVPPAVAFDAHFANVSLRALRDAFAREKS